MEILQLAGNCWKRWIMTREMEVQASILKYIICFIRFRFSSIFQPLCSLNGDLPPWPNCSNKMSVRTVPKFSTAVLLGVQNTPPIFYLKDLSV